LLPVPHFRCYSYKPSICRSLLRLQPLEAKEGKGIHRKKGGKSLVTLLPILEPAIRLAEGKRERGEKSLGEKKKKRKGKRRAKIVLTVVAGFLSLPDWVRACRVGKGGEGEGGKEFPEEGIHPARCLFLLSLGSSYSRGAN